jgi:hypothetical protein
VTRALRYGLSTSSIPTQDERLEADARDRRIRRWMTLAEDGAVFGLTPAESAELARLEAELGPSGLAAEMRS